MIYTPVFMRIHLFLLCLCTFNVAPILSQTTKDSLINALSEAKNKEQRLETLTNLMDLSRKEQLIDYAKQLWNESQQADNDYYKEVALTEMLRYYVNTDKPDSAKLYIAIAKQELEKEARMYMIPFMEMMLDVRVNYYKGGEESKPIIERTLIDLKTNKNLSVTDKMKNNYILGMVAGGTVKPERSKESNREILSYFKTVVELSQKIPFRYAVLYQQSSYFMLTSYASGKEAADYAIQYMNTLQKYALTKEMQKRPYVSKRHMLNACTALAANSEFIGKEAAIRYYNQFLELNKKYPEDANLTPEYEYISTSLYHFASIKEYEKAIEQCDSMISFLTGTPYEENIALVTKFKINYYDSLQMYKEAYDTYKIYSVLLDSARIKSLDDKILNLEIQKTVNQLINEKTSLELEAGKNKERIYLFFSLLILALCAILIIIFRLWKMRTLYKQLKESNEKVIIASEKALESEKIKNGFIRNMYHEVRTPLNAINGFSGLIAEGDVSPEEKQEFSRIIYENCNQLTQMMNDVLEIAQLDSTTETLPLAPVHIFSVCQQEIEQRQKISNKLNIVYHLEGDESNDLIHTNLTGFTRVIAHLLHNATKFTEAGSIILAFHLDDTSRTATIRITDTGCGIPEDKREWVFGRFTKTDEFVPGSGLGLSLCRLITRHINGKLWIDPDYTGGTRFILTLPL